ncbi:MAG: GNAT family N-acetyltransferase [Clostridia bacterium]|nr:GNAT family N-acetyltransferase [Clostridia bacterium]
MIRTKRLVIKPLDDRDKNLLIEILRNEKVSASYLTPDITSNEAANKLFNRIKEVSYIPDRFARGIYIDNKLIGIINDTGIENGNVEIGYVIHPDHQNKGYATEALKAVIEKLFEQGYAAVSAGIFEDNIASRRVLEKCGFVLIDKTEDIEYQGKMHHCIYFEVRR